MILLKDTYHTITQEQLIFQTGKVTLTSLSEGDNNETLNSCKPVELTVIEHKLETHRQNDLSAKAVVSTTII